MQVHRRVFHTHSARIQFSLRSTVVFAASSFILSVAIKAMRLTKLTIVALFLLVRMCPAKIVIPTPNPHESTSTLGQDLVNILTSCYRDRTSGIVLAGNLSGTLLRTLSSQHLIPVTLFNDPSDFADDWRRVPVRFRRKLRVFVIETFLCVSLDDIVATIKYSIWWNHMASLFILDESPECENANQYLATAWYTDILNAKVMCYGNDARTIILSYNPFTSVAPASWQRVQVSPELFDHPFTVFSRVYSRNESTCVDLDYETTKDLGGYPIRAQGLPDFDMKHTKEDANVYNYLSTHVRILRTIYRTMNSTPRYSDRFTDEVTWTTDMATNSRWMAFTWTYTLITYPHEQTGFVIISQFRGHKTELDKIISIIDMYSLCGLAIVYLITLIFFKCFAGQDFMRAFLNLTRITSGTGLKNLPVNTASRIYLTSLLFFAVTILGIYQGNLASLLTKKIPLRNIDTVKDLANFGYIVYGHPALKNMIELPNFEKRFITTEEIGDCMMHVEYDSSAACIWPAQGGALDLARKLDLHVSSHFVVPIYIGFPIRWDWALEERVNAILAKMVEADVLQTWEVKCNPTKLSDFQYDEEVNKNKHHKVLELSELLFAFVILSIGLACAAIVFIAELMVHRFHNKIVTVRVEIVN